MKPVCHLKFNVKTQSGIYTLDDLKKDSMHGTDALFYATLIFPDSGGVNVSFKSVDGRKDGEEMSALDRFRILMLLSSRLMDDKSLPYLHQLICKTVYQLINNMTYGQSVEEDFPEGDETDF